MYYPGHKALERATARAGSVEAVARLTKIAPERLKALKRSEHPTPAESRALLACGKQRDVQFLADVPVAVVWPWDDRGRSKLTREQIKRESEAAQAEFRRMFPHLR